MKGVVEVENKVALVITIEVERTKSIEVTFELCDIARASDNRKKMRSDYRNARPPYYNINRGTKGSR